MSPQTMGELPCTAQVAFQSLIKILFEGILETDDAKKAPKRKNGPEAAKSVNTAAQ